MASGDSDKSINKQDFEALNVQSDSSSDLDLDGYSHDLIQLSPLLPLTGGRFTLSNEENEPATCILGCSTHCLPKEYLDLFKSGMDNNTLIHFHH